MIAKVHSEDVRLKEVDIAEGGGTQKGGATDAFGCWNLLPEGVWQPALNKRRVRDGNAGRAAVNLQPCLLAETL